jgi:hypothetical protein
MRDQKCMPLLVSPALKSVLVRKAKASNLAVNEFLRRAAEAYDPIDEEDLLRGLVAQVHLTTQEANAALDGALEACARSESRIAAMEAVHTARRSQTRAAAST